MPKVKCATSNMLRLQAERDRLSASPKGQELYGRHSELDANLKEAVANEHEAYHDLKDREISQSEYDAWLAIRKDAEDDFAEFVAGEWQDFYCVIDGQIADLENTLGIPRGILEIEFVEAPKTSGGIVGFFKNLIGPNGKMH